MLKRFWAFQIWICLAFGCFGSFKTGVEEQRLLDAANGGRRCRSVSRGERGCGEGGAGRALCHMRSLVSWFMRWYIYGLFKQVRRQEAASEHMLVLWWRSLQASAPPGCMFSTWGAFHAQPSGFIPKRSVLWAWGFLCIYGVGSWGIFRGLFRRQCGCHGCASEAQPYGICWQYLLLVSLVKSGIFILNVGLYFMEFVYSKSL